ncbi:class I SAM-dependent methyltransferase [Candidatus Woesearchaeota archaeon]|nr:class I SAM-dependent methyltransferase [Candidatus Woesearchaeota archaeon]
MNYYDKIAKGYNGLYSEEQLNKLSTIKNNIKINKKMKMLDVGCGTGISSGFDCFVVGIDPSLGLLKKDKNAKKLLGVAESLPFKNRSFDYVISITAIHNFNNIKKSIDEIKRVGKVRYVFSVLKKSKKFNTIKNLIEKNFKVEKVIEEGKDTIFFCQNHNLYIYKITTIE